MEPAQEEQQPPRRLRQFYKALALAYGPQHWWPSESQLETIIGAYLTQNTSWRNVVRSIDNLRDAGALTLPGIRALNDEQLRTLIRPSGYMVRKGAAIRAFVALLDERYSGSFTEMAAAPVERTREHLLHLPGVGPETADAILLYALNQPVMVVDEYLRRVVTRHGLIDERARYAGVQQLALAAFAQDHRTDLLQHYNEFHALIVEVGKTHCGGVPRCSGCPLNRPEFAPPPAEAKAPRVIARRMVSS